MPIIFFDPSNTELAGTTDQIIQHTDILPSILYYLDYNKPFFAFGKSMLSEESWALSFLQNEYTFITKDGILSNKAEHYKMYSDWEFTQEKEANEEDLKKLKAIKQSYNQRMINNKLLIIVIPSMNKS